MQCISNLLGCFAQSTSLRTGCLGWRQNVSRWAEGGKIIPTFRTRSVAMKAFSQPFPEMSKYKVINKYFLLKIGLRHIWTENINQNQVILHFSRDLSTSQCPFHRLFFLQVSQRSLANEGAECIFETLGILLGMETKGLGTIETLRCTNIDVVFPGLRKLYITCDIYQLFQGLIFRHRTICRTSHELFCNCRCIYHDLLLTSFHGTSFSISLPFC